MTEIKICGITDRDDALFAAECGIAALGFIFYALSPRYVSPVKAREIMAALPAEVAKVGVFVNQEIWEVERIADFCGLDFIQLHGDETPGYCRSFPASRLIKAFFLQNEQDLETLKSYPVQAVLVDSRDAGRYGGTGKKANWELALKAKDGQRLILSGGLSEENIAEALTLVSPAAVDLNSGVEIVPGRKDRGKIRRVVQIIESMGKGDGNGKIFVK